MAHMIITTAMLLEVYWARVMGQTLSYSILPTSAHKILLTPLWARYLLLYRQGNKTHKVWASPLHAALLSGSPGTRTQVCQAPKSMFLIIILRCHDVLYLFYFSLPSIVKCQQMCAWIQRVYYAKYVLKYFSPCAVRRTPQPPFHAQFEGGRSKAGGREETGLGSWPYAALSGNGKVCCRRCPALPSWSLNGTHQACLPDYLQGYSCYLCSLSEEKS